MLSKRGIKTKFHVTYDPKKEKLKLDRLEENVKIEKE